MGLLPTAPKTPEEVVGMGVDHAIDALPLGVGSIIPGGARADIKKAAAEAANQPGWFGDLIQSIFALIQGISDWIDGKKTELRAALDKNGATAETTMLARIGQTVDGKAQGVNPFADIDKKFGLTVGDTIQKAAADTIKQTSSAGITTSKATAYEGALAFHNAVLGIYKDALMKKYGTSANDEGALNAVAEHLASTVSGVGTDIAKAENPSLWLEKNPPKAGLAAMLLGTYAVASKAPTDSLVATQIPNYTTEPTALVAANTKLTKFQTDAQQRLAATTQAAAQPAADAGVVPAHGTGLIVPQINVSTQKARG